MLHMPNRLTSYAKRDVEVEKNDKILYFYPKIIFSDEAHLYKYALLVRQQSRRPLSDIIASRK